MLIFCAKTMFFARISGLLVYISGFVRRRPKDADGCAPCKETSDIICKSLLNGGITHAYKNPDAHTSAVLRDFMSYLEKSLFLLF